MNYRTANLCALACSACLIIAVLLAGCLASRAVAAEPPRCYEDMPCWTWSTMGDMQRGVVVHGFARNVGKPHPNGKRNHRVVEPCEFAYLDWTGGLNLKRTPKLKGDWIARRHGCDPHYFA